MMKEFLWIDMSGRLSSKEFVRRLREAEALSKSAKVRERAERREIVDLGLPQALRRLTYKWQVVHGGWFAVSLHQESDIGHAWHGACKHRLV